MRLVTRELLPGGQVLWVNGSDALASDGYRLLVGDAAKGTWQQLGSVPASPVKRILSRVRLASRALRLGIHGVRRLTSGTMLAVVSGWVCRSTDGGETFELTHRFQVGNKPAYAAFTVLSTGEVYYGEYSRQTERVHPIRLCRSDDEGRTFAEVYRFEPGQVRHIHYVLPDPFEPGLWVGTGDRNDECRMLRSLDGGETFEAIGQGSQQWRAVTLQFRPEAVYWGSDAGCDAGAEPNWICRWDRASCRLERVQEVQGPVHAIAQLADGTLLVSTGVEGGVNEHDDRAHLWASRDGRHWEELANWQKDIYPFRVQYGLIHFAHGQETADRLYLNLRGLKGYGLTCLAGRIEE